jgi:hypothetical protein
MGKVASVREEDGAGELFKHGGQGSAEKDRRC